MSETLAKKLDEIFKEEINFSRGVISNDYYSEQFHYFYLSLQYLYFNNLHIGKYNKLFAGFDIFNNSNTRFYLRILEKLRRIKEKEYVKESDIERFLISNHRFFKKIIKDKKDTNGVEILLNKRFDTELYNRIDKSYFKPAVNIYTLANNEPQFCQYLENIVLTNSLASLDYKKGYSDVDVLIIIKEEAFSSVNSLRKVKKTISRLSKQLYFFDPTQHHGFFIVNEVDLLFYPQSYYPTILFKHSVNLMDKDSKLTYKYRDDHTEKKLALYKNLCSLLNYTKNKKDVYSNLATLKSFISSITLLPVLYIQLKNGYIYKRDAFEQLSDHFDDLSMFQKAEEMRSNFPYKRVIKYFPGFLHPSLIPIVHCKLYKNNISRNAEELQALTRKFLESFINKLYSHRT